MRYYCVVCGKENYSPGDTLYKFPTTAFKRNEWLKILNISSVSTRGKVCAKHFEDCDIVGNRLKIGTVPCKFISAAKPLATFKIVPVVTPKKSLTPIRPYPDGELCPPFQPSVLQFPTPESQQKNTEKTGARDLKVNALKLQVRKLSAANKRLKLQATSWKLKAKERIHVRKTFGKSPALLQLIESQIKRSTKPASQYTTFEKSLAVSLYYSGGRSGYRMLHNIGFQIPSIAAISRWADSFHFNTGINKLLFKALKDYAMTLTSKERNCVLVWDEMSLKEFIEYNKCSDSLEGIVDFGKFGKKLTSANEVLVFMLQGIENNWCLPISFYFSSGSTTAEMLKNVIDENITEVHGTGFYVRLCISDMAFTNQAVYKSWEIAVGTPFKYFNEQKVYFVHDTPHLVKLIRNNLMKHVFKITKKIGNMYYSFRVKWLHLLTFYNKDTRISTRMAPKLTRAHLYLRGFSKMRVKLATQLLSHSVFAGMSTMIKRKILKPELKPTAEFVRNVDRMFDSLNISKYDSDKFSRCAKNFNPGVFNKHLQFIESITLEKCDREPEFLRGLKITLTGIKLICEDLISEGAKFVYTRRMQQDCLENFFSAVRQKGGFCRNPTARQFRVNFKYLFLGKLLKTSPKGNTEGMMSAFLNPVHLPNVTVNSAPQNAFSSNNMTLSSTNFFDVKYSRRLKLGEDQASCATAYLSAYIIRNVVRSTNCLQCKLLISSEHDNQPETHHLLADFKKYDVSCELTYLDKETCTLFIYVNSQFEKAVLDMLSSDATNIICKMLEVYQTDAKVSNWLAEKCSAHRLIMITNFLRVKLVRLVKDKNEKIKQIKSWSQSRRDQRNQ